MGDNCINAKQENHVEVVKIDALVSNGEVFRLFPPMFTNIFAASMFTFGIWVKTTLTAAKSRSLFS